MVSDLDRTSTSRRREDRFERVNYSFKRAENLFKEKKDRRALSKLLELKQQYFELMDNLKKARNELLFPVAGAIIYYIDDVTTGDKKALEALETGIRSARNTVCFLSEDV